MHVSVPTAASTSTTKSIETSVAGTIPASILVTGAGFVVDNDDGILLIDIGRRPQ